MSGNSDHSFQEVADRYMLDHCYYPLVLSDSLVFDRPFKMIVSPMSDAKILLSVFILYRIYMA